MSTNNSVALAYDLVNVSIISKPYEDIVDGGSNSFVAQNCDFTGMGIYVVNTSNVRVDSCNFYGTNTTDAMFVIWGGNDISFTNNTGQDYNYQSTNLIDRAHGRLFDSSNIYGPQSNVYVANNQTYNLGTPPGTNSNSGEQILWEASLGTQSCLATSATSGTVTLASLAGDYVGRTVFVTGGTGTGEYRTIVSTNFATGGTTLTLDSPWDVIPDATSIINLVACPTRIVVYANKLQSIAGAGTASTGFELFSGGADVIVDGNTMTNMNHGICEASGGYGNGTIPGFFNIYQNNTFINCKDGIRTTDIGNTQNEIATHLGNILAQQHHDWHSDRGMDSFRRLRNECNDRHRCVRTQ